MDQPEFKENGNEIHVYSNYYQYKHIQAGSQLEVPSRLTAIIEYLRNNYEKFKEIKEYKESEKMIQCLPNTDQDQIMTMLQTLSRKN